jgi:hypothetical protein
MVHAATSALQSDAILAHSHTQRAREIQTSRPSRLCRDKASEQQCTVRAVVSPLLLLLLLLCGLEPSFITL